MMPKITQFFTLLFLICIGGCGEIVKASNSKTETWQNMTLVKDEFYVREYSIKHLKEAPLQTVQKILIEIKHFPLNAKEIPQDRVYLHDDGLDGAVLSIYVKYKHLPNWYHQDANCHKKTIESLYKCYIDGDGGNVVLELNGSQDLVLKGYARMEMCGILWEESAVSVPNATMNLNNSKNQAENYVLHLSDKENSSQLLKGTKCQI